MRIPNCEHAFVDLIKLEGYALALDHPVGKHKARVFLSALGLEKADAPKLKAHLLKAVESIDATEAESDSFGTRYNILSTMTNQGKTAQILSAWIIRTGEDFPRLVSCYIAGEQK